MLVKFRFWARSLVKREFYENKHIKAKNFSKKFSACFLLLKSPPTAGFQCF